MPTDPAHILTLAQWLSPAYPVGAFSYSHGLEQAIDSGHVTDQPSLRTWILDVLEHGSGRSDALFLAAAFQAGTIEDVAALDTTCRAFASSHERLMETTLQGAAFAQTTSAAFDLNVPEACYPVAVGHAVRLAKLPLELASSMFLQAFVSNMVAVGQRLIPLGQTAGQQVITTLNPVCTRIAKATLHGDLAALSGTAFMAEIAAMKHETQYSRIFRT